MKSNNTQYSFANFSKLYSPQSKGSVSNQANSDSECSNATQLNLPQFSPTQFSLAQFSPPQFNPPQFNPPQFNPPQFNNLFSNSLTCNNSSMGVASQPKAIDAATGVDAAVADPDLSTLTKLLGDTGLVPALQNAEKQGPITIFAPSNQAFDDLFKKVGPDIAAKLADPKNKDILSGILKYHVSGSPIQFPTNSSSQSAQVQTLDDVNGYTVTGSAANPQINNPGNGGPVTGSQALEAKNGTIIVPINQVLIPPDFDPSKLQ